MIINAANLQTAFIAFNAAYQRGLTQGEAQWNQIATTITSTTGKEEYGWLGKLPGMRRWIGDRQVNNLNQHKYSIENEDFEDSVAVNANHIEDDTLGIYTPMFVEMGEAVMAHPDQLVFDLLKAGFSTTCFDGQFFFDTDHPVLDKDGETVSVANTDGGSGTPWYLLNTRRSLKPLIYQERKKAVLTSMTKMEDEGVFMRNEYRYGVHARCAVGFGFWQMAWGSKQTLNAANFETGLESMMSFKGDYGRPLGIRPNLLVVPPSLRSNAKEVIKAERDAAGATNVNFEEVDILVVPWLA